MPAAPSANPVSNRLPDVLDKRKTAVSSGAEPVVPLASQVLDQTPAATTLPGEKAPPVRRPAKRRPDAPAQVARAVDSVTNWPSSVSAKSRPATVSQASSQSADALVRPVDRPAAEAIDLTIVPLAGQSVSQLKVETPIERAQPLRSVVHSASTLDADTSPAEPPRTNRLPVEYRSALPTAAHVTTPHQAHADGRRVADDRPIVPRPDPALTPERPTRGISQPEARAESLPTIRVTIGRVEVRTTPTSPSKAVSGNRSAHPALSLQDYLKQNQSRKP
jgi:hypothetical protein